MKSLIRRLTALGLLVCLCLLLPPSARAAGFTDVSRSHWAYGAITAMTEKGYIQGSQNRFLPGSPISKQAFLSMLCRASGLDDRKLQKGVNWADPAISFGKYFGWITEREILDRTNPISRELAAQLLVKAFFPDSVSDGAGLSFRDRSQITAERLPYVAAAVRLGLIGGYADGSFDPHGPVTRAAAAVMLQRALQKLGTPVPTGQAIQVPILMYHDVSYLGEGYSKTPEIFRAQMKELKDAGFHTVFLSQVLDFVENGTPLPSKPIVISVDDGYATNYTYLYPILQELDMKIELSVVGDAVKWAKWGLRWDQIREMTASGLVRIQCHTNALHGDNSQQGGRLGVLKVPDESWDNYVKVIAEDTVKIRDAITEELGTPPLVFTYPRGKWNHMAEGISAQLGFPISLTTKDGVASVRQGDPGTLRLMDRIGMDFLNGSVLSALRKYGYKG